LSREYPPYAVASVGAVLIKNGAILLIKRGYPPREGYWSIPGGVIEPGETIYDAARRELEEETGVTADPLGVVGVAQAIVRDEAGRVRFHYVIVDVLFDPNTVRGSQRPGGDAVDVAWMPLEEAVSRPDVTGTTRRLVKQIREKGIRLIEVV